MELMSLFKEILLKDSSLFTSPANSPLTTKNQNWRNKVFFSKLAHKLLLSIKDVIDRRRVDDWRRDSGRLQRSFRVEIRNSENNIFCWLQKQKESWAVAWTNLFRCFQLFLALQELRPVGINKVSCESKFAASTILIVWWIFSILSWGASSSDSARSLNAKSTANRFGSIWRRFTISRCLMTLNHCHSRTNSPTFHFLPRSQLARKWKNKMSLSFDERKSVHFYYELEQKSVSFLMSHSRNKWAWKTWELFFLLAAQWAIAMLNKKRDR